MQRKTEPWSGTNPIPKAATDLKSLVDPQRVASAKAEKLQDQDEEVEQEKKERMAKRMSKGEAMKVRDPTTGDDVEISNADDSQDERSSTKNVLNMDMPPPDWTQHKDVMLSTTTSSLITIAATYTASAILLHFISLPSIHHQSIAQVLASLVLPSIIAYILLFRLRRISQDDFEDRAWHSERARGMKAGSDLDGDGRVGTEERTKESAEWANTLLQGIWPIVDSQLFQSSVDLLEDIMQSSVPSFIHSVRVADLGQGSHPLRITAIRSLRDADTEDAMEALEDQDMRQLQGDHVNLEVSFAYRAMPSGKSTSSKAQNVHLLLEFFMGMKNVWGFRVPILVEIKGIAGTARARIQLISDPPFMKTTLITMMGLPRVSIDVTPTNVLPNVMNLPVVSEFIANSINAAVAQYVAPRSLTLDLQQLISGDDIKKDTTAIGVLVVHIHRGTGLKKMDSKGLSGYSPDPYITLTYSRLKKPMFSSRIIKNELNPVFEETAILLVNVDNVKLKEQLSIQLWDSDRFSADDMMGFFEMDIVDLIRNKGKSSRKIAHLESPDFKGRSGDIELTVGYYGKMWPNPALKTDGSDPGIPVDLKQAPEFKEARAKALNDLEAAVLVTPPDSEYPSGILSMKIHEIKDLVVSTSGKETTGNREGKKGQDQAGESHEGGEGLPSSYCTISLNDELIYETRVKPLSSSPMFNAGAERALRDWRSSHVTVTVKDSRVRENDAVLGIVFLKLSDLFVNASQVTRSYPVEAGGRIRISVLFRPVSLKLPQNLLGFDTGLLALKALKIKSDHNNFSDRISELVIRTTCYPKKERVTHKSSGTDSGGRNWLESRELCFPVRQRYSSALLIEVKSGFRWADTEVFGVFWLRDLKDNYASEVDVSLWSAKKSSLFRMKQNYMPPNGDLDNWGTDKVDISCIGTVSLDVNFLPGLSGAHHRMLAGADAKKRGVWEEFERQQAWGLRDTVEGRNEGEQDGEAGEGETSSDSEISQNDAVVEDNPRTSRKNHKEEDESSNDERTWKERWNRWREEEKELHREHLGIMQRKPARTAKWLVDNVEIAGHKIKDRFSHESREPDVETEV